MNLPYQEREPIKITDLTIVKEELFDNQELLRKY